MKKVFLFLLIALGVTVNVFALNLNNRIVILEDKSKVYNIVHNKEYDTTVYFVKMMARPFVNVSNIYELLSSEEGSVKVPDSLIRGWSRIYEKDIILERNLVLVGDQIFLQYSPEIKESYNIYYFFMCIFLFLIELMLIIWVMVGSKKYITFTGILIDIFILLLIILMTFWFLNYIKIINLSIGGITFWDALLQPIITVFPAFLVSFTKDYFDKKERRLKLNTVKKIESSDVGLTNLHQGHHH